MVLLGMSKDEMSSKPFDKETVMTLQSQEETLTTRKTIMPSKPIRNYSSLELSSLSSLKERNLDRGPNRNLRTGKTEFGALELLLHSDHRDADGNDVCFSIFDYVVVILLSFCYLPYF